MCPIIPPSLPSFVPHTHIITRSSVSSASSTSPLHFDFGLRLPPGPRSCHSFVLLSVKRCRQGCPILRPNFQTHPFFFPISNPDLTLTSSGLILFISHVRSFRTFRSILAWHNFGILLEREQKKATLSKASIGRSYVFKKQLSRPKTSLVYHNSFSFANCCVYSSWEWIVCMQCG